MLSWAALPTGKVVRLEGVRALPLAVNSLPREAPAILTWTARESRSARELAAAVVAELDATVLGLFPAWLPEAGTIDGPGGTGLEAVRALALRTAAATAHFGPFLAELAERALRARPGPLPDLRASFSPEVRPSGFPPEVRALGLARALAAAFSRTGAAILVDVPDEMSPAGQEALVAAGEWLAHRAGLGVWLTGLLPAVDRVETVLVPPPANPGVTSSRPERVTPASAEEPAPEGPHPPAPRSLRPPVPGSPPGSPHGPVAERPRPPVLGSLPGSPHAPVAGNPHALDAGGSHAPVAGSPHPASAAEHALEAALSGCAWAAGRAWNRTIQPGILANPVRVDLLWQDDWCIVELDGADHRDPAKFADDRARDVRLQIAGYAVLRFTDVQVLSDPQAVVRRIELFLQNRRASRKG